MIKTLVARHNFVKRGLLKGDDCNLIVVPAYRPLREMILDMKVGGIDFLQDEWQKPSPIFEKWGDCYDVY